MLRFFNNIRHKAWAATMIELKLQPYIGMFEGNAGKTALDMLEAFWEKFGSNFDGSRVERPQSWTIAFGAIVYWLTVGKETTNREVLELMALGMRQELDDALSYKRKSPDLKKLNSMDVGLLTGIDEIYQEYFTTRMLLKNPNNSALESCNSLRSDEI